MWRSGFGRAFSLSAIITLVATVAVSPASSFGATFSPSSCSPWRVVPSPSPIYAVELQGVSASSPQDMWAVGSQSGLPSSGIAVHSDGSTWSSPTTVPGCRNVYSVGGVSR